MKKNYVTKLGALALALTLITTCMMGSTLARYVSEVTADGTAKIAAWKMVMEPGVAKKDEKFTLDLSTTKIGTNSLVKSDTVAPGDTGKFEISFDGRGTEVEYTYSIKIDTSKLIYAKDKPVNIEFYEKDTNNKETVWTDIEGTAAVGTDVNINKTIYWRWVGEVEGESKSTQNESDTTAGESAAATNAQPLEFTVTMKAEQKLPTP